MFQSYSQYTHTQTKTIRFNANVNKTPIILVETKKSHIVYSNFTAAALELS